MGIKGKPSLVAKVSAAFLITAVLLAMFSLLYLLLPRQIFESLMNLLKDGGSSLVSGHVAGKLIFISLIALYVVGKIYHAYEKAWFIRFFHGIARILQRFISDPETPDYCEDIHSLKLKLFPEIELHGVSIKLYGRDDEFKWLMKQLSILRSNSPKEARAVLLWGTQGIGKTQLAYCFATHMIERRRLFRRWHAWYVEGVFDAGRLLGSLPNAPVILVWDDVSLSDSSNSKNLQILRSNRGRKNPLFIITTGWQGRSEDYLFASDKIVNAELHVGPLTDTDSVKLYANAMLISAENRGHPLLLRLLAEQGAATDAELGVDPLWSVCRKWAKSFERRLNEVYGLSLEAKRALAVISCSGRCSWENAVEYFDLKVTDRDALAKTGRLRDRSGELWLDPLMPDLLGWAFCLEILNNTPPDLLRRWRLIAPELGPLTVPRFIAFALLKKQEKKLWVKMLRDIISDAEDNIYSNIIKSLEKVKFYAIEKRFDEMERELLGMYDSAQNCITLTDAQVLVADAGAHAVEAYLRSGSEHLANNHLDFIYKLAASPQTNIDIARIVTKIEFAKASFSKLESHAQEFNKEKKKLGEKDNSGFTNGIAIGTDERSYQKYAQCVASEVHSRIVWPIAKIRNFFYGIADELYSKSKVRAFNDSLQASRSLLSFVKLLNAIAIGILSLLAAVVFNLMPLNGLMLIALSILLITGAIAFRGSIKNVSVILSSFKRERLTAEGPEAVDLHEKSLESEKIERQLHQALRDAEAAVIAKGEFLATMSHEIRTPLNGIVPMLDLLMHNKLPPDQAEMVRTAFLSSQQMLRIVDDILDYSKLEASKLQLESTTFNLREMLESLIQLMERPAQSKGLRLNLQIDPSVRLPVRGDSVRLRQVLSNLISNAVKFTERGSIALKVRRIGETSAQDQLRFEVCDTGIGIAQAAQERLFQAFSQVDASTTRLYGGTGLGLAISKRIIDLMSGRIGVESEAGQGSTFWFEIPMLKVQGEILAAKPAEHTSGRMLLLTGDQRLRLRLSMLLPIWGLRITAVETTQEALDRIRSALSQGAEWAYTTVIADLASVRSTSVALQRNLERQAIYGQVRLICLQGDEAAPEELQQSATILHRQAPDADLRISLLGSAETVPSLSDAAPSFDGGYAAAPEPPPPAAPTAAALVSSVADPARPMRVLLVEDNPVNLMVGQRLLSVLGTHCDSATNGEAALLRMSASRYDLVLMDCQMPVMDGYTATRRWREHEAATGLRRLPIVGMTANARAGDPQKCLDSGMDDYLAKPVTRGELEHCLLHWQQLSLQSGLEPATPDAGGIATPAWPEPLPPVLDTEVLEELRSILGNEVNRLIEVFLDDTPRLIAALEAAATGPNYDMLRNASHTLRASSANLGAMSLSNAVKKLELNIRSQTLEQPAMAIARISDEFTQARKALEASMASLPSPPA